MITSVDLQEALKIIPSFSLVCCQQEICVQFRHSVWRSVGCCYLSSYDKARRQLRRASFAVRSCDTKDSVSNACLMFCYVTVSYYYSVGWFFSNSTIWRKSIIPDKVLYEQKKKECKQVILSKRYLRMGTVSTIKIRANSLFFRFMKFNIFLQNLIEPAPFNW